MIGLSERFEPLQEFPFPWAAFVGAFDVAHTETVAASLILDVAVRDVAGCECGVEEFAVVVMHNGVVFAVDDKYWGAVGWDMAFE